MAAPTSPGHGSLRFGVFELNLQTGELHKSGLKIGLRPQAAKVLILLATRGAQLVTREELKDQIWGSDTFVDFEHGLNLCIRQIRAALDDDANTPRYIETLPRRGYRFIAPVSRNGPAPAFAVATPDGSDTREPAGGLRSPAPVPHSIAPWRSRRWLRFGAAFLVLLALVPGIYLLRARMRPGAKPPAGKMMFAVLPFENLSGDPDQEYFSDGLTEEMISRLGQMDPQRLGIIARTSAIQYKGTKKRIDQIGKELGVDYVLEGTVRRAGDRVRVSAQLIQVSDQTHLWARIYERSLRDILNVQEDVAKAVAGEVKITLTPPEQMRLSSARPVDPAAHQAYLLGLHELHGATAEPTEPLQAQAIEKAIGYFQEALTHDPKDALAYAGLADAYSNLSTAYRAPLDVMPKAKAAATRAIELDDTLAEAHASLGYVALTFDWDWTRAEHEFRRALELNPSLPSAHASYAQYLLFVARRPDQSMQEMQQAYALDPLLPQAHGDLAWFLFLAKRYKESIEAAHRIGQDNRVTVALSYAELGQSEQALAAADRAAKSTQSPVTLSHVAAAYALAGRKDKARAMIPGIEGLARQRYVCGFNVACLYSTLGDKEQAFAWLEKAHRDRSD
jgi:TolB-like protein/DNA-binding winged helix-turn-helix (wHTH) protein/Flp pilus assembly protein TadD